MGWLDTLLGRTKPVEPDLDALFGVPNAAITLEAAAGVRPTGTGAVCFRPVEGADFTSVLDDLLRLLIRSGVEVERRSDSYGYTWLVISHSADDIAGLVTDLHAVNSTLRDAGFGPALLCSFVAFRLAAGPDTARPAGPVALVYLYKRGTFYPFVPAGDQRRDSQLELQLRGELAGELPLEPDLTRWFPIWDAPGL